MMAARLGLEPRLRGPKPRVLPLHYPAVAGLVLALLSR